MMYTVKDYLKYYKDLSFDEYPFNEVDNILFSELSYFDWSNIVNDNKVSLGSAIIEYLKNRKTPNTPFMKGCLENLKIMKDSLRYKDILLGNYYSEIDDEKQFGAICIYFDNKVYISFEGTDGTIIGWKEDLTLSYLFPIASQKLAIEYLNRVVTRKDKTILLGGHSKGGNLAMTAYMYADDYIKNKVKYIYNNDGPGFLKNEYNSKEFKEMLPKLKMFIPEESLVGLLLYGSDDYVVVKSNARGIMQHNLNTWQCFGTFLERGKLSNISKKLDERITSFYQYYDDDDFKEMIDTFFKIFEDNNIKSFYDMKNISWKEILSLINNIGNIDSSTKKLYIEAIKDFILN